MSALEKSFGATAALRGCSFDLHAGEVHAIVGENGSGKSTLVKVLAGVHRPDRGDVRLGDGVAHRLRSPRGAHRVKLFTVFQEVLVVGSQTVLENVWLGADPLLARPALADAEKRQRAARVLEELLDSPPSLDAPAESLSLSDRQACCVARALVRDPRVLILDESTSALDVQTRDRLFEIVRRLCASGSGVIFISHRMDEIEDLADRVTVLRSGQSIATLTRAESSTDLLVRHMTGAEHLTADTNVAEHLTSDKATPSRRRGATGEVILRAEGIRLTSDAAEVSFTLSRGELIGLAGLEGHGQDAFLRALYGGAGTGQVTCAGAVIGSAEQAVGAGVVYVPRDRRGEAIFPTLSVGENFAVPTLTRDRRAGLLRGAPGAQRLSPYVEQLGIRFAGARAPITSLSGGNQQKVIVARWLAAEPKVLLLNDPTRGVDLNAKRDLYRVLEQLAEAGLAVVMLSSEVDEHVELMDRVLVFREGTVFTELSRERLTRAGLVGAFFGRAEVTR